MLARPLHVHARTVGGRAGRAVAAVALAAASLLGVVPGIPSTVPVARAAETLPSGFVDQAVVTNLRKPTAISFAPDGRVFVAEKRGVVKTWKSYASFSANDAPAQTLDIRTDVMNYWDRGLLGMAVDPGYPGAGHNFLYVLYSYDVMPGSTSPAPKWGRNVSPPDDDDACHSPANGGPGPTTDGCPVLGRLDRVTINTATGVASGRSALVTGWCQQFPSHSVGSLAFGADGMLYVSGGEGANFNVGSQDWGQYGGTVPNTDNPYVPANPCADPVNSAYLPNGTRYGNLDPNAEGGALRAQSVRRPAGQPRLLNGAVLRLDPATGAGAVGNPLASSTDANARRIVAYGFRNPFRIAIRPGTNDVWIGDVGNTTWEEINRLASPTGSTTPANYGWPCYEGPDGATYYKSQIPAMCSTTALPRSATKSAVYTYRHSNHMVTGDTCATGSSSISGLAFYTATSFPAAYRGALFAADYSRNCIIYLPASNGIPSAAGAKPFASGAANPVGLAMAPDGSLVYPDFDESTPTAGSIHRIRYHPPIASFTVTPASGAVPLKVAFNGSASAAPTTITSYAWDFGDGTTTTGTTATTSHTYTSPGTYHPRLTVTAGGVFSTASRTVSAANSAPVVVIDSPSSTLAWKVGQLIGLKAHATDAQDGTLPASAFTWTIVLNHCNTPTDCHKHALTGYTGRNDIPVTAPDALAGPDHDFPSWLTITVTATDSNGLAASAHVDVHPATTMLRAVSNPAGLPVTIDGTTGAGSVGPDEVIVGHRATIEAAATARLGDTEYAFGSWSDGGAEGHTVTSPATATTYTATYRQTGIVDAADACADAPVEPVSGAWTPGHFSKANDVDWLRFSVPSTRWYRILLGGLPVDATLQLYSGCSTLIATSSHAGRVAEELVQSLAAGTYALKVTSVGGVTSADAYQTRVRGLTGTVALLSTSQGPTTTGLRFVGEVFNTSTSPRTVTVTADLFSASHTLLGTFSASPLLPTLAGGGRSPWIVRTTLPTGYASVEFHVTSAAATTATRTLSTTAVTTSSPASDTWNVSGQVKNTSTTSASSAVALVWLMNSLANVANATTQAVSPSTLAAGASAPFSVSFRLLPELPTATLTKASAK